MVVFLLLLRRWLDLREGAEQVRRYRPESRRVLPVPASADALLISLSRNLQTSEDKCLAYHGVPDHVGRAASTLLHVHCAADHGQRS